MAIERRISALALAGVVLAAGAGVSGAASPAKQVASDPAGDWGEGLSPASAAGDGAGQDLISAFIGPGDPGYLNFTIHVSKLAPADSTVAAVYEWYFIVGGRQFGFYGPCQAHIYGDCATATDPLSFVLTDFSGGKDVMAIAQVNANAATITFPVPLDFIGAKRGSIIEPRAAGEAPDGEAIVAHTFYFVNVPQAGTQSPRDYMKVTKNYKVR